MTTLILLLYAGIGMGSIIPFARHLYRNKSSHDGPGYIALMAWLSSLVWPITGVIYSTAHVIQRDNREREKARTLEGARAIVAREEARLARVAEDQRRDRNKRLRKQLTDFDKQMAQIEGISTIDQPKRSTWQDHIEDLRRRGMYDFDS